MKAATTKVYKFGRFSLDTGRHLLLKDGFPLQLREKVFETLVILVEAGGAVVPKDEFMEKIWPDAFVEENSLNRNISELRKALSSGVDDAPYIETVPKRGYRFAASVETLEHAGLQSPIHLPQKNEARFHDGLRRLIVSRTAILLIAVAFCALGIRDGAY